MSNEGNSEWMEALQKTRLTSRLRQKESLKRFNTWRIGGDAECLIDVVNIANGVNMMEYAQIVEFPSDIPTAYSYVYKGYLDPSVPGGKYFERKPTFIRIEKV